MSTITPRVPHIIAPYVALPPENSLTLVTSVLNASSNWFLLRYLLATLGGSVPTTQAIDIVNDGPAEGISVVFVSFLRDWDFWKDSAKRLQCDLVKKSRSGHFHYIDGLRHLFNDQNDTNVDGRTTLRDPALGSVRDEIAKGIQTTRVKVPGSKVLLIIDGLDLYTAATGQGVELVLDMIASWREQVYSTVITASADLPLVKAPETPLEKNHSALMVSLAHQARAVISLRLLSTGVAKDVSGILRISRGPYADEHSSEAIQEKELLYYISGDGNVKVFERGSG